MKNFIDFENTVDIYSGYYLFKICLKISVQFFDPASSTYTYLLADVNTKEAILIDPVIEWVERDKTIVEELGLLLKYAREYASRDHYLVSINFAVREK